MSRSRSPVAIDFGEHAVRALQIERRGDTFRVRAAASEAVERSASAPTEWRDRAVETGRRLLKNHGFRGSSAIVALRLSDITTRHIRVPTEKLEHAGELIAKQVQDQSNDDVELSICPLPIAELFDQGERKREFLCCIAKSDAIQQLIDVTEAIGLVPVAIDLEPCALVRPYVHRSPTESFLHLDIGAENSRITIVRGGAPVLMRSAAVGANRLQDLLRTRLQMEIEDLLDLTPEPGSAEQAELHDTLLGTLAEPIETLLVRVADGIRYCGALFQGRAVNLMRVSGRIAALPGLVPYLGRRIGITAEVAEPFAGITDGPPLSGFDTALGLAIRGATA